MRSNPQSWIVQAIAKRRHAPLIGTPRARAPAAVSFEATSGPSTPGPNSGAVAASAMGTAVTASPVSVSSAIRTGARVFVGAINQVALSPGLPGRRVTAVAGAFTALATWAASHTGRLRIAASPEGKAGRGRSSMSVRPKATRSKAARRCTNAGLSGPTDARTTPGITK